ncbi:MAG: PAS domain S-box protein, partial [Desulfobacteraceae bacterium]
MDEKNTPKTTAAEGSALFFYDGLRAEIWTAATENHLTEEALIQRLLGVIGRFLNLDRVSFLGLDENKKEYYTKLQWHKPEVGSTLGVTVPCHMALFFLNQGYMELPKNRESDAALFAQKAFKRHQILSYLVLPYGDSLAPTGLFTFSDCRRMREWDEPVKNILAEVVNIISIRAAQIKNERILLASEERFRLLFEYSNDAVFIHDLQGRILDVNNRACEMLGYNREELIKMPLQALRPAVEWDASRQGLEETRAKGHTRFESCFKKKDGSIVDVEISARVVDAKKGIVQGIARDITERNQAFAVLQETKHKAEAANLAKSEFIANLTHELRTPIAGAIGMLDLTLDTVLSADQREYLEMAKYSVATLMGLVNDILDFA